VVADIAKLSVGREAYYTRELAENHEEYLSGHGESPGRWYGAGATTLGLQGEASPAGFQAMFEGRDPSTGELLGRPHGRDAVPAFDVVLRPTKSVSVLYGLGDPATGRAVLQAHHAGLAEAVGYLDEHLGARRGHGGYEHVSGQGLLAVGFDHRTSREGDPLLHTHLVVANRVQGPDGRWTALDGRDLYRHRLAADAIYRATYQRQLVRTLGVEWTAADAYGNRELLGMPEALVRGFSKRAGQIDAEVERLGADGRERTPRLVKWAVQATRKPKQHETPDTLYGRWRAEAAERGHDADTLVRTVTDRTPDRDQDRTVSAEAVGGLFDRLAGPDGLTENASTFTRPDVLVALGAGLAGVGRTEVEELADRFLAERAVSVVADRALEERRWSTPDLLAVEQGLVESATGRTDEQTAVATHAAVRDALAAHPTAGQDQAAMVRDLCQGAAMLVLINELRTICDYDPATGVSCKADRIAEIIGNIAAAGEKAVVFSYLLKPLDLLEERLKQTGILSAQLQGSMSLAEREAEIRRFRGDSTVPALLASSRIGGEGLTLTEANHVIFVNEWWNPSANSQARDRVVRLGQRRGVRVYRFRCRDTIEETLDRILEKKTHTFTSIIDRLADTAAIQDPNVHQLLKELEVDLPRGLTPRSGH
jgi:conjugative relaxase-like TrwC/TraI family protein